MSIISVHTRQEFQTANIDFNDGLGGVCMSVPAGAEITSAHIRFISAFDTGVKLSLGFNGNSGALIDATEQNSAVSLWITTTKKEDVIITLSAPSAQGQAQVAIFYSLPTKEPRDY